MKLLLARRQSRSWIFSLIPLRFGSGVIFHLKAELELDREEEALIKKYRFAKAVLVESNAFDDLKRAFRSALVVGLLAVLIAWLFTPLLASLVSWWFLLLVGPVAQAVTFGLVTIVMTIVYFRVLRERILVSDLLDGGRTFHCDSIILLIRKEAFLETICEYLRQVLESAKHWDEREIIPIQPLNKVQAKWVVLQGV